MLRTVGKLLVVDGKPDFKARFAGAGLKFNLAAMTVADNAIADLQAKAGAGADGFRCEKWLEHTRLDFRRDAGTVVHDFDDDLIVFQRGADTDFASAIYGSDRVTR